MYWFSPLCVFKCALMMPSAGQYSCSWWNCLTFLHCAFSSNVLGFHSAGQYSSSWWRATWSTSCTGRTAAGWGTRLGEESYSLGMGESCKYIFNVSEKQNSGRMQDTIGWGKCIELFWKSKNYSFGMVDWESGFIENGQHIVNREDLSQVRFIKRLNVKILFNNDILNK